MIDPPAIPELSHLVNRLRHDVLDPLKRRFVGRDEVIDLIALAVVAGEHLFLYGPPGTAKSALIRQFAELVHARYFEYLLTRFSEPNELFGPIDLVKLREGSVATVTRGMLPEAEFVFLDELFNANSAILNNLLTVLNERVYRRGSEVHQLPLLSLFSASNHLPEDEALQALFDRFLLRCHVNQLKRSDMPDLLTSGWALERPSCPPPSISAEDLKALSEQLHYVDLSPILQPYGEIAWKIRDHGIALSDRRAVKLLKLVAASSLLCGRMVAQFSDLWILRYAWDRPEQIDPLTSLVNSSLEQFASEQETSAHPLSRISGRTDPEELERQLEELSLQIESSPRTLLEIVRLRERAGHLADQAAWVTDDEHRRHLVLRTRKLQEMLR